MKLTQHQFYKYCDEYDLLYKTNNSRNCDMFNEGRNIIGFILQKTSNDFTYLIYKNDLNLIQPFLHQLTDIFHFNQHHIWLHKKINNQWYKLDSNTIPINSPIQSTLGYMFVIPKQLKPQIENHFIQQIKQSSILKQQNKEIFYKSNLLDNAEIPIYNLYHLTKKYPTINNIAEKFRTNKNNKEIIQLLTQINFK